MDFESIMLSEISGTEEDKNWMILLLWNVKQKLTSQTKQKQTHRYRQQNGDYQRGSRVEGGEVGKGVTRGNRRKLDFVWGAPSKVHRC